MTIKSNLATLKERQIEIKGYLHEKLKARHLEWIVEHLHDPIAEELFQILIQERNERAKVNSNQSLEISRKEGKIIQLDKKNESLNDENVNLRQEVSYWQDKFQELLQSFEHLRQDLFDFDKSEIYQLGKWLKDSLSKVGQERQQALLEKELVHKDNYNLAVSDLKNTIQEQQEGITQLKDHSSSVVESLEETNDKMRNQLDAIRSYIINNYGSRKWQEITQYFDVDQDIAP
jgi:predicted RNase H-like nuclease (RuvC/YqgF family)